MTTILIVEDEKPARQLLIAILTLEYQVIQATDVAQAIETARLNQPDLVLLDLTLKSDRDGLKVCQALRSEVDPVLGQVPIVILTGEFGEQSIKAALTAGANSYISKPYSPIALLSVVDMLLARGRCVIDMVSPMQ